MAAKRVLAVLSEHGYWGVELVGLCDANRRAAACAAAEL